MPRTRLPDRPNGLWHLTHRVNHQVWHLHPERSYGELVRAVEESALAFDVDILAFVAMSNHFHAVVRSPAEERYRVHTTRQSRGRHRRAFPGGHPRAGVIGQFVRKCALQVARRIQSRLGVSGHLWEGPHDRVLIRSRRQLVATIAYDHRNPVKAGITARPEEYSRSSAAHWAGEGSSPISLLQRSDLPFESAWPDLQRSVLEYQKCRQLDLVMEQVMLSRTRIDSPRGAETLERLLNEAGLPSAA
jgi:REP element-mobilizing transposase RayT